MSESMSKWIEDFDMPCGTKVQRLPEVRKGIMQLDAVLRDSYIVEARGRTVVGAWVFMGIDPGDRLEFDTNIYLDNVPLVLRSEHKPQSQDYDAWRWYPNVMVPGPVDVIVIDVVANVTGRNSVVPRQEGTDTARPHWGIWIVYKCSSNDLPPPPPPPPVESADPEDYLTLSRVEFILPSFRTDLQFNAWAGWRDPEFVALKCPNEVIPLTQLTVKELKAFADAGLKLDGEGARLLIRLPIVNERAFANPRFGGRSEVRKTTYSDFRNRLTNHLAIAMHFRDVAQQVGHERGFPPFDSIKGYCEEHLRRA